MSHLFPLSQEERQRQVILPDGALSAADGAPVRQPYELLPVIISGLLHSHLTAHLIRQQTLKML